MTQYEFISIDFKAHETDTASLRRESSTVASIPAGEKEANLLGGKEAKEGKEGRGREGARRRKLSAETIMSALQRTASSLATNWRSHQHQHSCPEAELSPPSSPATPEAGDTAAPPPAPPSAPSPDTAQLSGRRVSLTGKKLTTIPSVDYQVSR